QPSPGPTTPRRRPCAERHAPTADGPCRSVLGEVACGYAQRTQQGEDLRALLGVVDPQAEVHRHQIASGGLDDLTALVGDGGERAAAVVGVGTLVDQA